MKETKAVGEAEEGIQKVSDGEEERERAIERREVGEMDARREKDE